MAPEKKLNCHLIQFFKLISELWKKEGCNRDRVKQKSYCWVFGKKLRVQNGGGWWIGR